MAKVVRFYETGGPEVLCVEDVPTPPPGPDEITIGVQAFGLNRAELMFLGGLHPLKPRLPSRLGMEAAGIVEAVGANVSEFARGDAVSLMNTMKANEFGAWGEALTVPASWVVHSPPELTAGEVAGLWCAYITAYGGLVDLARLKPGDTVLITAASSSVGIAAIQMVNMVGGISVAVTRHRNKAAQLGELGARHVIVSDEENIAQRVREITGGKGANLVFDPVAGPALAELAELTAPYGTLVIYGVLSPHPPPFPLAPVIQNNLSIHGYAMYLDDDPERNKRAVAFIRDGIAGGYLRPVIARRYGLDEIVDACRYFDSFEHIGKVVITVD